jgi:HD-GYP domain-containing protein (c-di-GMP phosphodiesterase class II)
VESQSQIKKQFKRAFNLALNESMEQCKEIYCDVRDVIVEETLSAVNNIIYKSQLKVYGDYNYTHGLNVSISSTLLAHKLGLNDEKIKDIALAAILHDIGKTRIPADIISKPILTAKENKLLQLHPQIGYRIIKREMGLPEHIALVSLEHHEKNDGSGYPYGISSDLISLASQIIMVCDAFDNIISNRGTVKVKNGKEAMRMLLEHGSRWFTPNILYTFIYMSNYNDTLPIL